MKNQIVRVALLSIVTVAMPILLWAQSPFQSGTGKMEKDLDIGWKEKAYIQFSLAQKRLRSEITSVVRKNRGSVFSSAFLILVGLSFLYGVVHAVGPGHGKSIVMSYMLSEDSPTLFKGILVGTIVAFGEAASAIVIVYSIFFLSLGRMGPNFAKAENLIKTGSYGFILLIGLILLLFRIKKYTEKFIKKNKPSNPDQMRPKSGILVAASLGIIPCPGVMVLLLFMLAMKLPLTGVVLALFMALGMAITISGFGLSVIVFKTRLLSIFSSNHRYLEAIEAILGISGAILIIIVASVMLLI